MAALPQPEVNAVLNRTIRSVVPTTLRISGTDRAELRQAILNEWAVYEGLGKGQVRAGPTRLEVMISAAELREALRPYAVEAVQQMGLLEDFRTRARFQDPEMQQRAVEGVVEGQELPEAPTEQVPLLAEMAQGSLDDRTKAALIGMHLGQYVIPGQPKAWLMRVKYDPKTQQREVKTLGPAVEAFNLYHMRTGKKKGQPCPMCRKIARFFRVPGVEQPDIQRIMDWYVDKGQAQLMTYMG